MTDNRKPDGGNTIAIIGGLVSIVVALIGCFGAVAVAGIEPFAGWAIQILNQTPAPTDYVPVTPGTVFQTATVPVLSTTMMPGEDWEKNCISSQWITYPEPIGNVNFECYAEPVLDSLYTRNGGLYIFAQPTSMISTKEYGLFVKLPQRAEVRVKLDLDVVENGQVWFGVFSQQNVYSDGVVIVAPDGDIKKHAFAVKENINQLMLDNSRYYENEQGIYSLGFFVESGALTPIVEDETLVTVPFSSADRWLFIGYRAKLYVENGSADIRALFSDLEIK